MKLSVMISSIALWLAFGVVLAAARECPLESDCFQKLCTGFRYDFGDTIRNFFQAGDVSVLHAECKDDAGKRTSTSLDLKKCIVNFGGEMHWGDNGNHGCLGCSLVEGKTKDDPVMLDCLLCPMGDEGNGFFISSQINLSYGIWVKDGALGCYQHTGEKKPRMKSPLIEGRRVPKARLGSA